MYNLNELRSIDLNIIILYLYNGIEDGTNERYNTRKYSLPSKNKIAITGYKWIDNLTGIGGFGAIDLVQYLQSSNLIDAIKILYNFNKKNSINLSNINQYTIKNVKIPESCDYTWSYVKSYLINNRKLPEFLLNKLYSNKLIWSDKKRNCIFPRDLRSGAYLRGTIPGSKFKMTIGLNGMPYVIPGNELIIITEAPIDGISLKYYYPNAKIISTGGRIGFDKIKPYISNNLKIYLAQDNDIAGDNQAEKLKSLINNNVERLRPIYGLKDWNEVLIYEFNKKNN
jgi:hypothetical protein